MFGNLAWSFNNEFLHLNQFFDQNFGKIFRTKKFKLFYKIWLIESGLNRYDIIEVSRNFAQAFGNLRTKKNSDFPTWPRHDLETISSLRSRVIKTRVIRDISWNGRGIRQWGHFTTKNAFEKLELECQPDSTKVNRYHQS